MWIVLIEWDGAQPPTTYYTSLHNLCLRVRGDKEYEPIVRRAGEYNKAVIVQEGAVIVPSESLAHQVAHLAQQEGARSVMTGNVELNEDTNRQLTDSELEVIRRFNDTFKKRGRPSLSDTEEKDWVITCPECVHTSIATARKVIQCPRCGGLRVASRVGTRERLVRPSNLSEWIGSRFFSGSFEIPTVTSEPGQGTLHKMTYIDDSQSEDVIDKMRQTDWINKSTNFDLLDMVFCARRYYTAKDRQHARVECCLRMYEQGFDKSEISIFEDKDVYEPIDAAIYYMGNYKGLISIYKSMKGG